MQARGKGAGETAEAFDRVFISLADDDDRGQQNEKNDHGQKYGKFHYCLSLKKVVCLSTG